MGEEIRVISAAVSETASHSNIVGAFQAGIGQIEQLLLELVEKTGGKTETNIVKCQLDVILVCGRVLIECFGNNLVVVLSVVVSEAESEIVETKDSSGFVNRRYCDVCCFHRVSTWINDDGRGLSYIS